MTVKATDNKIGSLENCYGDREAENFDPPGCLISQAQADILLREVIAVSLPYVDLQGKIIQLWKYKNLLVASVVEGEKIAIIFGEKIFNALQLTESGTALSEKG